MLMDKLTSKQLEIGKVYTRKKLIDLFNISDATINTGVFHPSGTSSVWLFITEQKSADLTPYNDLLDGNILFWQGQMAGRTDKMIINHKARGLELLIFFRKKKYEHPGAGFKYLGQFVYFSHTGNKPASFILSRESNADVIIPSNAAGEDDFDPTTIEDARERISRSITQRRGQKQFRHDLMAAYGGKCAITDCSVIDVLEASHIQPYRGQHTNKVTNGLLLRSDIHTLFDCGLLAIDSETMTIIISGKLKGSEYEVLDGKNLRVPYEHTQRPNSEALNMHRQESGL